MGHVGRFFKIVRGMTGRRFLIAVVCLIALAGASSLALGSWLYRAGLDLARRDINEGKSEAARSRLAWMTRFWTDNGEIAYLQGLCAAKEGMVDEALSAWRR